MGIQVDLPRVDQEEELATDVVGIIQHQRILLHKGPLIAEPRELE